MITSTMSKIAFHEMGHALINYTNFDNINNLNKLKSISIIPKDGSKGRNAYSEQYFTHAKEAESKYKVISPDPITTNDVDKLKKECLTKIAGIISENIYYDSVLTPERASKRRKTLDTSFTSEKATGEVRTDHLKFYALYYELLNIGSNTPDFKTFSTCCWNKVEDFYKIEENKLLLIECSYILSKEKELQGSSLITYFTQGKLFIKNCQQAKNKISLKNPLIEITTELIINMLREDNPFEVLITNNLTPLMIENTVKSKLNKLIRLNWP